MLEVEQKFRLADPARRERLIARLRDVGAVETGTTRQVDVYYSRPDRDLIAAGEALRVRRDDRGAALCWKGKRQQGPFKTREEIELALAASEGKPAQLLLERLGYVAVGTVTKTRAGFRLSGVDPWPNAISIAVDDVEGLGLFVELELVVAGELVEEAQRAIESLARDLGLEEVEPRSYLKLLSADCGD
jgi:adenylate cyclase, class 2